MKNKRAPYSTTGYIRVPYTNIHWNFEMLEILAKTNKAVAACRIDEDEVEHDTADDDWRDGHPLDFGDK